MNKESIEKLWRDYLKLNPDAPEVYETWAFGDSKEMADELADLVVKGIKTATASNYVLYELEKEALPHTGLHNVILNGNGDAVAIVETTSVEVIPFDEVTAEQAYLEGEGDRSLGYWREVHEEFYRKELEVIGREFTNQIPIVCERLKLLYKR